jgi:hypothetical protein
MEFVSHKSIKGFSIDGKIKDEADFGRLRIRYENLLEDDMRIKGYIPHLDLDPVFTTSYNGSSFEFKITCYGIYVGKAKAKCYTGITGTRLVPMIPTIQTKLMRSSMSAESQLDLS